MSNKVVNTLSVAVGAALLGTVMVANAANPFRLSDLGQGYQVGDKPAADTSKEGKCGEGKCSAAKKKCKEMTCAADKKDKCWSDAKTADAHCGASFKHKAGEATCAAAKGKEGSCSADKKGKEGSCSADKKGKEGSCGGDKH